jgi:DNA repair protein RecN (Recombination protein N)
MLTALTIKHFALLEHLHLELATGLTVVTGETGAGKSIVFDALGLALGDRADHSLFSQQTQACDISAMFDISQLPQARQWLTTHALLDESQTDECTVRRVITPDGRSRSFIDGTPCTVAQLRELRDRLISIHGQHEHQALLDKDFQLALLDSYAGHAELVQQTQACYQQWHACYQQRQALLQLQDQTAQAQLLQYQVNELDSLALGSEELPALEKEYKQLQHAQQHLQTCHQVYTQLAGDEEEQTVLARLQTMQTSLAQAQPHYEALTGIVELLQQALIHAEEAADELADITETIIVDPQRLNEVEHRLQQIHDIARKHQVPADQLPELQQKLSEQLASITDSQQTLENLARQLTQLADRYQTSAAQLTASRQQTAKRLSQAVTELMHELALSGGQFSVELQPLADERPRPNGNEQLEFKVTTNPGHPLQALAKVASGGELSRISLAIQVLTAQQEATPTLLFDEVDVGIGGNTAAVVGRLLRQLSDKVQILCITHQPQVAAMGQHHLQVSKHQQTDTTQTRLALLNDQQRVEEIARMLGGLTITKQTRAHAKELLTSQAA